MRRTLILIILLLTLSPFYTSNRFNTGFVVSEDIEIIYTFNIATGDYESVMLDTDSTFSVYGNITVTAPADARVTLKAMDQASYNLYTQYGGGLSWVLVNQLTESEFTFTHDSGPWYLVMENDELTAINVTLIYAYDMTGPEITVDVEEGTTYSGTMDITATAQDNRPGFVNVSLWIDSVLVSTTSLGFAYHEWDTTLYSDGPHNITVAASDVVGNSGRVVLQVFVSNSLSPIIPIIATIGVVAVVVVWIFKKRM